MATNDKPIVIASAQDATNLIKDTINKKGTSNLDADTVKDLTNKIPREFQKELFNQNFPDAIDTDLGETQSDFDLSAAESRDIDRLIMQQHEMIINCSPIGTFPEIEARPDLPYEFLTSKHLLYDLIYNPEKTAFLKMGENAGAIISNGGSMLAFQADKSWEIWNS